MFSRTCDRGTTGESEKQITRHNYEPASAVIHAFNAPTKFVLVAKIDSAQVSEVATKDALLGIFDNWRRIRAI